MKRFKGAIIYFWQLFWSRYFFAVGFILALCCWVFLKYYAEPTIPLLIENNLDLEVEVVGDLVSFSVEDGYYSSGDLSVAKINNNYVDQFKLRITFQKNYEIDKGSTVNCRGRPKKIEPEMVDYYHSVGLIPVTFYCEEVSIKHYGKFKLDDIVTGIRRDLIIIIHKTLPQPQASLLLGMLIGSDEPLSKQFKGNFYAANTAHIIAVSGFNISLVAGVLLTSSRFIGRKRAIIFSNIGLIVFMCFVGWDNIPALRATIMHFYSCAAVWYGFKVDELNSLGLSILIILGIDPVVSLGLSFQMTVAACLGMIIIKPLLISFVKIPLINNTEVLTSLACQLSTSPLLIMLDKTVSAWGLVANVFIAPLISPVMLFGAIGLLLYKLIPMLGPYLFLPANILLDLLIRIVTIAGTMALTDGSVLKELVLIVLISILLLIINRIFVGK